MSTPLTRPTCGTCKFYDGPITGQNDPYVGICRWTSPQALYYPSTPWWWPKIDPDHDWCGMYSNVSAPPPPPPYLLYVWVGTGGTTTVPEVTQYPSQAAAQAAATALVAAAPAMKTLVVPVGS